MNEPPTPQPNAPPISVASPLRWLALGWQDLRTNPVPGLLHGVAASAFGMLLWVWAGSQFWWLVGAISALPLLAPVLLVGLLLLSRQAQLGYRAGMREVLQLWMAADLRMVLFGVLMGLAGMAWVLISAGVLLLWAGQAAGIVCPIPPSLPAPQIVELLQAARAKVLVAPSPSVDHELWQKTEQVRR